MAASTAASEVAAPEASPESDPTPEADFRTAVLTDKFKQCMKTQRPIHIPGAVEKLEKDIDLDLMLKAFAKGSEKGNAGAYKNGEPCMRGNFFLAYLDHASLTLTEAERYLPRLLNLCRSLIPTFHFVSSRIVIDPPGQRIPTLTADSDMIALQIWGEQRLKLVPSIMGLPVTAKRPEPLLAPTMSPGDALYVPQGLEVRFEDAPPLQRGESRWPTMYAVLSLRTNEHMLGVSLGKMLTDVLREADLSKDTDRFLRTAVTRKTLARRLIGDDAETQAEKRKTLEESLKAAVNEVAQKLNAGNLREHLAKRMAQLVNEQSDGATKIANFNIPDLHQPVLANSYVQITKGVKCECQPGSTRALFTRGSETLPLPIGESASYLISELSDGNPHVVSSLTCSDPLECVCVCQILAFKKCVELYFPGDEGVIWEEERRK